MLKMIKMKQKKFWSLVLTISTVLKKMSIFNSVY